ncbi:MAG: hypothetical protein Q9198_004728, partial [Flavoplaca austrocitrina]
ISDLAKLANSNLQWDRNLIWKFGNTSEDLFDKSRKWEYNLHDMKGRLLTKPSDSPTDGEKPSLWELRNRKFDRTQRILAGEEEDSATKSA